LGEGAETTPEPAVLDRPIPAGAAWLSGIHHQPCISGTPRPNRGVAFRNPVALARDRHRRHPRVLRRSRSGMVVGPDRCDSRPDIAYPLRVRYEFAKGELHRGSVGWASFFCPKWADEHFREVEANRHAFCFPTVDPDWWLILLAFAVHVLRM